MTNKDNFISLLFYFGLITINGKEKGKTKFIIPNYTIKELIFGFIRNGYKDVYDFNINVYKLVDLVSQMAYDGNYKDVFNFIANEINRIIVLRDFIDGERVVQAYFMALFSITNNYIIEHEKQQALGFSDMVFKPFYSVYDDAEYGYLVEFKYLSKKNYSKEMENLYIEDATKQLKRYETDDKFKKELLLAPYGDKNLIKLIVLFVEGELKLLQEVK